VGGATPGRLGEGLGGRTPLPVGGGRTPAWGAGAGGRSKSICSSLYHDVTNHHQHPLTPAILPKLQCGARAVRVVGAVLQPMLQVEMAAAQ
jgi:hypothetical protein